MAFQRTGRRWRARDSTPTAVFDRSNAYSHCSRCSRAHRLSKDAFLGAEVEIDRAAVEARVGETDAAIERIRHLLSIPCFLSPGLLRIDPKWAPLRGDPRFRKLAELKRE